MSIAVQANLVTKIQCVQIDVGEIVSFGSESLTDHKECNVHIFVFENLKHLLRQCWITIVNTKSKCVLNPAIEHQIPTREISYWRNSRGNLQRWNQFEQIELSLIR